MKVLFWNIAKNDNLSLIIQCLNEYDIDLAIFSEHENCKFVDIASKTDNKYKWISGMGGCQKITAIAKDIISCNVKQEQARYVLYETECDSVKYIITGVHLHDRRSREAATRISTIGRLTNDVANLERKVDSKNTIIIGDFNANPFDDELLQFNAFHAVLFKDVIRKSETRTHDNVSYRRFYNPILNYISEDTKMYGSYYYSQGASTSVWYCLDQVLVSRALIDNLINMTYLKKIGKTSLLKSLQPNGEISDHLPLLVTFR